MGIELNNKILVYMIVYMLIPLMLLCGFKVNNDKNILERGTTNVFKGVLVLYVAIHHYVQKIINPELLNPLNYVGFLCVSFFFLMSGYGLTLGYDKDNTLKGFFKKRFLRLYFPFVVANIIISLLYNIFTSNSYSVIDILITSLTLRTIYSKAMLWYVFVQALMYLVFYFSFKIFKDRRVQIISVLVLTIIYMLLSAKLDIGIWRYNTVLCFTLGVIVASYKDNIKQILDKRIIITIVSLSGIFLLGWGFIYLNAYRNIATFISAILFALLLTSMTYRFKINSRLLEFLGNISYEIYIVQLPIIYIVLDLLGGNQIALPLILLTTILVAYISNRLASFINCRIK